MKLPGSSLLILLAAIGSVLFAGCSSPRLAQVHPWEKAAFVDYTMRPDRDPLATAMSEHIFSSRESAAGGRAVGGSGCGCN